MKPNTKAMQGGIQSAIKQMEGRFLECWSNAALN